MKTVLLAGWILWQSSGRGFYAADARETREACLEAARQRIERLVPLKEQRQPIENGWMGLVDRPGGNASDATAYWLRCWPVGHDPRR